jgi:DNA-binding PadR family transcriptional regulator
LAENCHFGMKYITWCNCSFQSRSLSINVCIGHSPELYILRFPRQYRQRALCVYSFMDPYRIQQLIKERGKDQVINVQRRASLYQAIKQLRRAELIIVRETSCEENHPELTNYKLTEKGLQIARDWLRDMLSTPAQEFPEFPAAISLLPLLIPKRITWSEEWLRQFIASDTEMDTGE